MPKIILNDTLVENKIVNNIFVNFSQKESVLFISILEIFLSLINEENLRKYYNQSKQYLTVKELGYLYYSSNINKDGGLLGKVFERFVYDLIISKEEKITNFLVGALSKLDAIGYNNQTDTYFQNLGQINKISDEVDVILWADEKGEWVKDSNINLTLNYINENDIIIVKGKAYKFKEILKDISYNNGIYGNLGKADLFVKQRGYNVWHGVNIKKNIEDLKMTSNKYKNLDIGIALTTNKLDYIKKGLVYNGYHFFNEQLPENKYVYVVPQEKYIGEMVEYEINNMKFFLNNIVCKDPSSSNSNRELASLSDIYKFLFFYRDESVFKIIEYLENNLKRDGIFLPERIYLENNIGSFMINGDIKFSAKYNDGIDNKIIENSYSA